MYIITFSRYFDWSKRIDLSHIIISYVGIWNHFILVMNHNNRIISFNIQADHCKCHQWPNSFISYYSYFKARSSTNRHHWRYFGIIIMGMTCLTFYAPVSWSLTMEFEQGNVVISVLTNVYWRLFDWSVPFHNYTK